MMHRRTALLMVLSLLLVGCGGGGGDVATTKSSTVMPTLYAPYQGTIFTVPASAACGAGTGTACTGSGAKVAVLDGGLPQSSGSYTGSYGSSVIASANQTYTYNSSTNSFSASGATDTYTNIHGNLVSEVAVGDAGIAPNASLISGVVSSTSGTASPYDLTLAMGWAANAQHANVINISFTYGGISAIPINQAANGTAQQQLQQAVSYLVSNNALLVHASGNNNENISTVVKNNTLSNVNTGFVDLLYTGAYNNVIIAGAWSTAASARASYSATAGDSSYSDENVENRFLLANGTVTVNGATYYGTSFAAATISGSAALLKERWPTLGGREISQILLTTANRSYSGYSKTTDGMGLLDINAAMSPVGNTNITVTSVSNVTPMNNAVVTLPAGISVSTTATTAVVDSFSRDFQIPISGFFRNMSDMRFSQFQSYFTGLDVQASQRGIGVSQLAGDAHSLIQLGSVGLVSGVRGRYGERSAVLPYLSDRTLFDGLAQSSHWYSGIAVGDWQVKQFLAGDDLNGQAVGSAIRYKPSSGLFAQLGVATGHLSGLNQLGMMQALEMGWQKNGITLKVYDQHLHLQDDLLLNGSDIRTSGLVLGQEWYVGDAITLGWLARHEENSGYLDVRLATGQDLSGNMLLRDARVGLTGARNELGVSAVYGPITAMGLASDTGNHGVLFAYRKGF